MELQLQSVRLCEHVGFRVEAASPKLGDEDVHGRGVRHVGICARAFVQSPACRRI